MRASTLAVAVIFAAAIACETGDAASVPETTPTCIDSYPSGGEPNRTFDVLLEDGSARSVSFASLRCDDKLIVLRVHAMSSGPGRWDAAHLGETLEKNLLVRTRVIDVLVTDDDAAPATPDDRVTWQKRQDVKTLVSVDASAPWAAPGHALPRILLLDPRTMKIAADLEDPGPDPTADAVAAALAAMDGTSKPAARARKLVDARFDRRQWQMLQDTRIAGTPPVDPTNKYGDRADAAAFGQLLFEDPLLSPRGDVSCSACHERPRAMTDGSPTATRGVGGSMRNTPTLVTAAWNRWQLWDGRADTLWMQALFPIEDENEFGSSRLFVAHRIVDAYARRYQDVFGTLPNITDEGRFPRNGKPGDPSWARMTPDDQAATTSVFANVGKAIAAFERTFRVNASRIDLYATGYLDQLTEPEKNGALAFFESGCAQCHWGNRLTDDAFHDIRFPTGSKLKVQDPGRKDGVTRYLASEFRADGAFSDQKMPPRIPKVAPLGAFKTPPLRGAALTAPYGHGGSVPNLVYALEIHRTLGLPEDSDLTQGVADPRLVPFDASRSSDILAFLGALDLQFSSQ